VCHNDTHSKHSSGWTRGSRFDYFWRTSLGWVSDCK
jgi:hypothetical protein